MKTIKRHPILSKTAIKTTCISLACQWSKSVLVKRQDPVVRGVINNQSGQVIVEYILLLFISVTIATFLTTKLINRNPDNPGLITGAWHQMNQAIGSDIVD